MQKLHTVILHHVTRQGSHYDWLMETPSQIPDTGTQLWTARIELPPESWQTDRKLMLTPIAPHRRHYLTYQGPISNGRGSVRRIAQGWFVADAWTAGRRLLQVQWTSSQGQPLESVAMSVEIHLRPRANWFTVSRDV